MKAISLLAARKVAMVEVLEPIPGPEDVLIDVHYVGLCGSDLNAYRGAFPFIQYPRILGHEASGIVTAKGPGVPHAIHIGDRVTLSPYSSCGMCPACRAGRTNCCQFNQTLGLQRDGVLAGRAALHYSDLFASQMLSLEELALIEPLSVGYHATNRGRVRETDTVLAIGCGAVGIGVIAASRRKGATVIAVDVDEAKLNLARRFGAQHTVNSSVQDVLSAVQDLTTGNGVHVAIEAVGLPDTFRLAVEAVAFAGRVVYIGYAKSEVCYDTTLFVRKELDVLGARNALRVFPAVINMVEQRQFPFLDLISATYPFAQAGNALREWDADPPRFAKVLIDVRA
jgi:threonine dehydrogenase-like Zn-dependent dehydrogenase